MTPPIPDIPMLPYYPGRPFWSVMVLAPGPGCEGLDATLRSVLDQDPGPDRMQLVVVGSNASGEELQTIPGRLAAGRVECHRVGGSPGRVGLLNEAIRLSRGRWVHLPLAGDLFLPGFYQRLGMADALSPVVATAFCQHLWASGDRLLMLSPLERAEPARLDDWTVRAVRSIRVLWPAAVARRDAYERVGGFRDDLGLAAEWEMVIRIALRFPSWFEPTVLARIGTPGESLVGWLRRESDRIRSLGDAIDAIRAQVPEALRGLVGRDLRPLLREALLAGAFESLMAGDYRAATAQLREVRRHDPWLPIRPDGRRLHVWSTKLRIRALVGRPPRPSAGDLSRTGSEAPSGPHEV